MGVIKDKDSGGFSFFCEICHKEILYQPDSNKTQAVSIFCEECNKVMKTPNIYKFLR